MLLLHCFRVLRLPSCLSSALKLTALPQLLKHTADATPKYPTDAAHDGHKTSPASSSFIFRAGWSIVLCDKLVPSVVADFFGGGSLQRSASSWTSYKKVRQKQVVFQNHECDIFSHLDLTFSPTRDSHGTLAIISYHHDDDEALAAAPLVSLLLFHTSTC